MKTSFAIGWLLLVVSQVDAAANPAPAAGGLAPFAYTGAVGAVCLALVLLVTKVMPARDARHAKTIESIEARHSETVKEVCDRFAEAVDKATAQQADTAEVVRKASEQQAASTEVVRNLAVHCQARRT